MPDTLMPEETNNMAFTPTPNVSPTTQSSSVSNIDTALDIQEMPALDLPDFEAPEMGSTQKQLDTMLGKDSLLTQRAKHAGNQLSEQMGQGRGSMAAGNALGAMVDRLTPIATADATAVNDAALLDWKGKTDQAVNEYNKMYEERMKSLGYDNERIKMIMSSNTMLSDQLMDSAGKLLSNTDLENSSELVDWMTENILYPAQDSNNAFVGNIYEFGGAE